MRKLPSRFARLMKKNRHYRVCLNVKPISGSNDLHYTINPIISFSNLSGEGVPFY